MSGDVLVGGLIESTAPVVDDIYLTVSEVCSRLRLDPQTLANHRTAGEGLPFVKISGKVLYRVRDVLAAELAGAKGFKWSRLEAALDTFKGIPPAVRVELVKHLKSELRKP